MSNKNTVPILAIASIFAIVIIVVLALDVVRINTSYQDSIGLAISGHNVKWSQWYSIHSPNGTGDYETLSEIRDHDISLCAKPIAIECQTTRGESHKSTKQRVTCDPNVGLICNNSLNNGNSKNITCKDYKVRFACPIAPKPKCMDSDRGLNYNVYGVANLTTYDSNKTVISVGYVNDYCYSSTDGTAVDSCTGADCQLNEVYCNSNGLSRKNYTCPNGCNNGACITYKCTDSDGGGLNQQYMAGTAKIDNMTLSDACNIKISNGVNDQYNLATSCNAEANCFISEATCNPNSNYNGIMGLGNSLIPCPNGCNNGACIKNIPQQNCSQARDQCMTQLGLAGCRAGGINECGIALQNCQNTFYNCQCNVSYKTCKDNLASAGCIDSGTGDCAIAQQNCINTFNACYNNNFSACADSDGIDYYIKGYSVNKIGKDYDSCQVRTWNEERQFWEDTQVTSCPANTNNNLYSSENPNGSKDRQCEVAERTCSHEGYISSYTQYCENGCADGACLNPPILVTGTLSDYPEFLFDSSKNFIGQIIIGQYAPANDTIFAVDIVASLNRYNSDNTGSTALSPLPVGMVLLDSDASASYTKPLVIIGMPCYNTFASYYLNYPTDCTQGYVDGVGRLDFMTKNGQSAVMVSGYSSNDIKAAARVLAQWSTYESQIVPGRSLCIKYNQDYSAITLYACDPINTTTVQPYCNDSDGDNQFKPGTVSGITAANLQYKYSDTCNGNILMEYRCEYGLPVGKPYTCEAVPGYESGCDENKCLPIYCQNKVLVQNNSPMIVNGKYGQLMFNLTEWDTVNEKIRMDIVATTGEVNEWLSKGDRITINGGEVYIKDILISDAGGNSAMAYVCYDSTV